MTPIQDWSRSDPADGVRLCSYASSELPLLKDAAGYLRQKRFAPIHFADMGASGHHTLYMAGIADHIIAFEPFPALVRAIEAKSR